MDSKPEFYSEMGKATDHRESRRERALLSLDGLSVGDAFGQLLSTRARSARQVVEGGGLPGPFWWHTDDTQMAMAMVEELFAEGRISEESLSRRFVERYRADTGRGYGKGVRMQMDQIAAGISWRESSASAFSGRGSMGNGGAMRSAPLGAYFADDAGLLITESVKSAIVTHSHPEGIAGSVAVSLAAAAAWNARGLTVAEARGRIWRTVMEGTPAGETLEGIRKAGAVPFSMEPAFAARILGSGYRVTAPDTVPFALWCALRHLDDFREAMISTLEGDGDCDTNCAIAGGIVALFVGKSGIPADWLRARERLNLDFGR
ncbi:MAG: ADP-ribosylglycohydrolase family protein [Verrucomicrobiota bacterium]